MRVELGPEGRYLLEFDTRDLPRYTTEVLVVGAGIAGLSSALAAAGSAHVLVLLKDDVMVSNTAWAQGGIAAAVGAHDTTGDHIADTLRTGCGICDEAVVRHVVGEAPAAIERLVAVGTRFDADNGGFALGREGGHSHRRVLHHGDTTGAECVRALVEAVRGAANIHLMPRAFVLDLLVADGRCVGALVRRENGEMFTVFARSVLIASGGAGRLFRETSNVRGATGDGIAAAYRAGAELRDMEFVQFHPTTLYLAGTERALVTEAVRGEGARIVDNLGRRFLVDAHPDAELAPRDFVSCAIIEHLGRADVTDVYLDMTHWPKGRASQRFPGLVRTCERYGLDPERDRIPVRPAAHYFIGGIRCDLDGRSTLPGLLACGEAASVGLHGANRLASNSLLEGLVLGRRAGHAAVSMRTELFGGHVTHRMRRDIPADIVDVDDLRESLVNRMWRSVGVQRDDAGLDDAAEAIALWRRFSGRLPLFTRGGFELENLLLLGSLVVGGASLRRESRGTHSRLDYPRPDDAHFRGSFCWREGVDARFEPCAMPVEEGQLG